MLRGSWRWLTLSLVLATAHAGIVSAALRHQYTFNDGTVTDSVGGAAYNGSIVDPGGIAGFVNGQIDLSGNNTAGNGGISSNQATAEDPTAFTTGAYIDLPNFLVRDSAFEGTRGAISFELWATEQTQRTWARLFDFGQSDQGENTATGGNASDYVFLTSSSGADLRLGVRYGAGALETATNGPRQTTGVEHHYAVVLDQTDFTVGANGTTYLYVDGALAASNNIPDGLLLDSVLDDNNWLGRSQWPDPLFDGSYNEFRVYDHALSATEVSDSFTAGPVPFTGPNPTLSIDRTTGAATLSNTGGTGSLKSYTLMSATGAIDNVAWTPISGRLDAGNGTFDPSSAWTVSSSTSSEVAEGANTGSGGTINSSTSVSLGNLWHQTPTEDIVGEATLGDGSVVSLTIEYTGNGGNALGRSDFNGDGTVNEADWTIFSANLFGEFSELSVAAAYGKGDLNGDKVVDVSDYRFFRNDFEAAQGVGSFQAMLNSVPEPASAALLLSLVAGAFGMLRRSRKVAALAVVAAAGMLVSSSSASADMVHRYSFNISADDSIGGANGTVVDAGVGVNYAFVGGQIDLSANTGQGSNDITEDAYVDLPNGIVTAAVNSGTNGAISFEWWATVATQRTWQRFGDFGTSNDGEDTSSSGSTAAYVLITPNSGRYTDGLEMTNHPASNSEEPNVGLTGPFDVGVEHHVVAVYDHNDATSGPNGTMSLYYDGGLVGQNFISADIDLRTMVDNNNWLGRSQWNDPVFDGSFNEFRIYDHALSATEVADSLAAGPDAGVPRLSLDVNTVTGVVTIKNDNAASVEFDFYEIASAGGALKPSTWNSLSDQNYQSVGNGVGESWDEGGASDSSVIGEAFLKGTSTLAANSSVSLGSAFDTSKFGAGQDGDLVFTFSSPEGATLEGTVTYSNEPGGLLGDYNGNGSVDAADYTI
ncbi:MAG: PEP-CTERM sorting domain-containing protein, partial [Planctomycetales bacterium]|nr:PEP-CTERM sorting domain-containing protein [Planctomycetales bacterium]